MFSKKMIISGFVSGVMLAATSFATPASAGQVSFNLDIGIESLLNELIAPEEIAPKVHNIDYRGVPIRKIHRKMRRRGLYPVSDYRLRGDRVIIRAEDDYGTLFRVVADADYGDIIRIRRIREESRRRRAPVEQPFYDDGYDNYRPGYDRPIRRNKPRYNRSHAGRKVDKRMRAQKKAAQLRADAARRTKQLRADAARRTRQAKADTARRAKQLRADAARRTRQAKADTARRARQLRADAARRARQARADRNRRAGVQSAPKSKKPYIGLTPKQYKEQQLGGGK